MLPRRYLELNDLEYEEYFRFEVIDERGRRAATRAYYLNEILGYEKPAQ